MKHDMEKALYQFIGEHEGSMHPDHKKVSNVGHAGMPLIRWETSRRVTRNLAQQGYAHISCFVVLPSRDAARWMLPSGDAQQAVEAFQMYQPMSLKARMLKRVLSGAIKIGWIRWFHPRLLVASRNPLPLERLVTELTGERRPSFALSLGTATRYRKLTVQVSRSDGVRLAYIKFPLTEAATARVRHEAETLKCLARFPALRPHIPELLQAGEWQGTSYILIQTCGPTRRGPSAFGGAHEHLLHMLWNANRTEKPGHVVVEEVAARWQEFAPLLNSELQQLGRRALERANLELAGIQIPCGIMHGDFTPQNTRVDKERLFLFDWEFASLQAPILWDVFHFHIQTGRPLNKIRENGIPVGHSAAIRALLVLYLLNSVCQLLDDGSPRTEAAIDYRRRILVDELSKPPAKN
jgi:hypothetical protein